MAEELKELIEKINEEGIKAAEEKSRAIEEEARLQAKAIIDKARKEASAVIADSRDKSARLEESTKASLKQAARDTLLSLRKEINAMLDNLLASHVHKALGAEEMTKLIVSMVKDYSAKSGEGIIVALKKEDLEKIERSLLGELRSEAKKGITLKTSDDIRGGFRVSYDEGKSYYDFTDQAIADYLGSYLKPRLAGILKETTRNKGE